MFWLSAYTKKGLPNIINMGIADMFSEWNYLVDEKRPKYDTPNRNRYADEYKPALIHMHIEK